MDSPHIGAHPLLGVSAKGIVQRSDGAVLIIKRSASSRTDAHRWDLPGGKISQGEMLPDSLIREALEETGLTVVEPRPFYVANFAEGSVWVTCVTFTCRALEGEIKLSSEHEDSAWISPLDLGGREYARAISEQLEAFVALRGTGTPS